MSAIVEAEATTINKTTNVDFIYNIIKTKNESVQKNMNNHILWYF